MVDYNLIVLNDVDGPFRHRAGEGFQRISRGM